LLSPFPLQHTMPDGRRPHAAASAAQSSGASAPPETALFSTLVEACESAGYDLPDGLSNSKQFLSEAQTADQSAKRNRAKLEESKFLETIAQSNADAGTAWAALAMDLQEELRSLYVLPPYNTRNGPTPSAFALLADQMVRFTPAASGAAVFPPAGDAASSAPGAAAAGGAASRASGIDITRPGGVQGSAVPLQQPLQQQPPASPSPHPVQQQQSPLLQAASPHPIDDPNFQRKWLMHDALEAMLHPAVYRVLDNYYLAAPPGPESGVNHGVLILSNFCLNYSKFWCVLN
jgi:hypothetical protein